MKIDKFIKYSCTNCGICYNSKNKLTFKENLTSLYNNNNFKEYCPGIGIDRKKVVLPTKEYNPLIGNLVSNYVGYSTNEAQRLNSSSGGVITEIICYLLKKKLVSGVCLPMPLDESETKHAYKICTLKDIEKIKKYSQSIYVKIPTYNVVSQIIDFDGKIAFVGLPDQTASLRIIAKQLKIQNKIEYFLGPMVGILMENEVIKMIKILSKSKSEIIKLRWRDGEWPGKLYGKFIDKEIRIEKFYYNYLLPFYCSNESLIQDDFANELSDISVADAWLPEYEDIGKGWSLVQSKTFKGDKLLNDIYKSKKISIEKINISKALRMHEHMIDFKKRGSKYRKKILKFLFIPVPKDYNLIIKFNFLRYIIEAIILLIIFVCKTNLFRFIMSKINQNFLGFIFSNFRIFWKKITKDVKRKGLYDNIESN